MWGCASIPVHKSNPTAALLLVLAATAFANPTAAFAFQKSPSTSAEPADSISPFVEAEELIQKGQYAQAAELLEQQIKMNPSSIEGYNLLGIAYTNEKDYERAGSAFQQALRISPASTKTHNNLGNLYVAEQKLDLAEKEFSAVLNLDPINRDANYNMGLLLLAKGSPSPAIQQFQRVHPATIESKFNLVRAYLEADKTQDALQTVTRAFGCSQAGRSAALHSRSLLASAKQYKAAQLELERANALQPETFEILYNLGQAYLKEREYSKAELALNRALKLKPDSAEALYLLAEVHSDQSRPVDALELLVRAHKLAPQNTDVIFLMARVSMTQNYFEDAIPLLESGLKIAPQRPDLHAASGRKFFMAGKTESAIEQFKKLIELDPSARSYAFMGLSYRHLGRFDEAQKYFEQGLKHDPHNASCLFNVGYIQERQGNYARAEELFQQALR